MANIAPNVVFPNMTVDATGITIPYTDLSGLTQVEADPATGDGRELLRVIVNSAVTAVNNLAVADRPARLSVAKPNPTGIGADQIRQSYTLSFDVSFDSSGVAMVSEA